MELSYKNILEVCNVYQPKTIATKNFIPDGKYTVYGANGEIGRYNDYNHEESEILMACRGATCGAINVSKPYSWINGNAMVIQPNGIVPIDKKYLQYFLMSIDKNKLITGTAQPQITRQNMSDFKIGLCEIEVQKCIVNRIEELFSELDKAEETLLKTKAQLEVYKKAVLSEAFPLVNDENTKKLMDIAEISSGITKGRKLEGQEVIELPYLRVANVQNGFLDLSEMKTIQLKQSEKERFLLKYLDVLYTEGGDKDKLGRGTVWRNEIENCVHQNHIFKARINRDVAIPEYVAYWSMTKFARDYFYSKAKQSVNLASINKTVLSNLEIPIPSLEEQKCTITIIEEKTTAYNKILDTIMKTLEQVRSLRQSILKEAFEGKLV